MSQAQVILVTGANKGIGYGIVQSLLSSAPSSSTIYLTSRSEESGRKALFELSGSAKRSKLVYHKLDISNQKSIDAMFDKIKSAHGQLDVLMNNASVARGFTRREPEAEPVEEMVRINYYGTLDMCKKFLPIMRPKTGRIVNVSSTVCHLNGFHSDELKKEISDPNLTIEHLNEMMERYKRDIRNGKSKEGGWPRGYSAGYATTKAAETALTRILARENPNLLINCCCPGWVDTDMGAHVGGKPPKSIDEGARIPCKLAIGDIHDVSGGFWENSSISDTGYGSVSVW